MEPFDDRGDDERGEEDRGDDERGDDERGEGPATLCSRLPNAIGLELAEDDGDDLPVPASAAAASAWAMS